MEEQQQQQQAVIETDLQVQHQLMQIHQTMQTQQLQQQQQQQQMHSQDPNHLFHPLPLVNRSSINIPPQGVVTTTSIQPQQQQISSHEAKAVGGLATGNTTVTVAEDEGVEIISASSSPVSYTHLTLPTIYSV